MRAFVLQGRAPQIVLGVNPKTMPNFKSVAELKGKKLGVVAGTSHEAYLKAMFTDAEIKSYANDDALRLALRRSEVDFIFGDAISLAFWINGTDSGECCAFSGGPFVESRYFGEGIGIAVRKGNDLLRQSLQQAAQQKCASPKRILLLPPDITRMLDKLEQRKLIERERLAAGEAET